MIRASGMALAILATCAHAQGVREFPATLAGHAILPAATFVAAPADAPHELQVSGRFTGPGNLRTDAIESLPGASGSGATARPTGLSTPFRGQPVQGFSGIKPAGDGHYWVLTDNGFGSKRNSPDALLMLHRIYPNFQAGDVHVAKTIFVSDPHRKVPFRIALEGTQARYLTGADFDLESIQPTTDGFWLGEEFGPYLIKVDRDGQVEHVIETQIDGRVVRSPDHPALQVPASPTETVAFEVQRSGGYEGMAQSPDGRRLYAMLEKPLLGKDGKPEGQFLRVIEFDTTKNAWTGRVLRYPLDPAATAIGDFNMIDDTRALVIERDNGEGDPARACTAGRTPPACFPSPARFKRVYVVDLANLDANNTIRKLGYVDLMNIRDPRKASRQNGDADPAAGTRFTFPFFTIENVARVDDRHIIVGNDNNLPFSAGRFLTRADDNELILLEVPELLGAR